MGVRWIYFNISHIIYVDYGTQHETQKIVHMISFGVLSFILIHNGIVHESIVHIHDPTK